MRAIGHQQLGGRSPAAAACAACLPASLPLLLPPLPQAYIVLNLNADLRSEFTWNTKQLFVFVNAEFATRKNANNHMVLWSAIVEDKVGAWGAAIRLLFGCTLIAYSAGCVDLSILVQTV